jgi:hypothetical protein
MLRHDERLGETAVVEFSPAPVNHALAEMDTEPPAEAGSSASALYVATDLDSWETWTPEPDQDEICERCGYRRLDPEYYAWLRHRMGMAKQARERGRLASAQYQALRQRFNAVHFWAVAHLGEKTLVATIGTLDRRPIGRRTSRTGRLYPAPNRSPGHHISFQLAAIGCSRKRSPRMQSPW